VTHFGSLSSTSCSVTLLVMAAPPFVRDFVKVIFIAGDSG
jgi:hypothetical protein